MDPALTKVGLPSGSNPDRDQFVISTTGSKHIDHRVADSSGINDKRESGARFGDMGAAEGFLDALDDFGVGRAERKPVEGGEAIAPECLALPGGAVEGF